MNMTRETVVNSAVLALLVLVPVVAQFRGDPFAITLATKVAIFALVILVLAFRPTGLFGARTVEKV